MQQIKKKVENPTFSAIAPENDFIANLPKTSKIVTNDGQSPFASFFTTGWFEPEPSG